MKFFAVICERPLIQSKLHFSALARLKVDLGKPFQFPDRAFLQRRIRFRLYIELDDLLSLHVSRICHTARYMEDICIFHFFSV